MNDLTQDLLLAFGSNEEILLDQNDSLDLVVESLNSIIDQGYQFANLSPLETALICYGRMTDEIYKKQLVSFKSVGFDPIHRKFNLVKLEFCKECSGYGYRNRYDGSSFVCPSCNGNRFAKVIK